MSLDDESLLSAYLDGELDPARRLVVENALLDDARLAERLRELAAVRALLGSLPRPRLERDLTPAVLASLPARPPMALRVPWLSAATALAAAAAVLVAILPHPIHHGHPRAGADHLATRPTPPASPSVPIPPAVSPLAAPAVAPAPTAPPVENITDRQRLLALLEQPDVPVLNVNLDTIDANAIADVQAAIHDVAPRVPVQGEIRLDRAQMVDPLRPGAAVVYVVLLDGAELESLAAQLCRRHPDRVRMTPPLTRDTLTLLANVGEVRFLEGPAVRPAARLQKPPTDVTLAFRDPTDPQPDGSPRPDSSTAERRAAAAGTAPARPCLIWLRASGP